ncbi:hypothetical protein B0T09DRAFT_348482 [Sordaria sp. MPI-SDFR-AT-0083]|nr:hypothetical protein B0T09DRAFT_348482 [Sordaria sp. MPI-SDFR-AT-0083]
MPLFATTCSSISLVTQAHGTMTASHWLVGRHQPAWILFSTFPLFLVVEAKHANYSEQGLPFFSYGRKPIVVCHRVGTWEV